MPASDDIDPALAGYLSLSLGGRPPQATATAPPVPAPLTAAAFGMSLHAATAVDGRDRPRLERLCRYLLRPPFAHDAVERLSEGRVRVQSALAILGGATADPITVATLPRRLGFGAPSFTPRDRAIASPDTANGSARIHFAARLDSSSSIAQAARLTSTYAPLPRRAHPRMKPPIREAAKRHPTLGGLLDALADDPAARWRRRGGAVLSLAGLVAASVFVARRDPPCADATAAIDRVWTGEARAEIGRSLRATGKPYAEQAATDVDRTLDAWTDRWRAQATKACEATRVHETQSEEMRDRASVCLHGRRRALMAAVDALASADAQIVEHASDIAHGLPDPDACADLEALARAVPPPSDPEVRRRAEILDAGLAEAWVLYAAGKYAEALDRAEPLLADATALGVRATEANAASLIARADVLDAAGE